MRRRGQMFSLDALISLVIVILMLGTITSTSSSLKNEIEGMIGWYERANIADNMLDVLTKSPGEPANWFNNTSELRVLGLASNLTMGVDYNKLNALIELIDRQNKNVVDSLNKLSTGKDFLMKFIRGRTIIGVDFEYNGNTEGGTGEYTPIDISCTVDLHGSEFVTPPAPPSNSEGGIVECDPFEVTGSGTLFFNYDYNLCFGGSVIASDENSGSVHISNNKVGSYVSIAGDLISEKKGAIQISVTYGSLYIGGVAWLDTTGSSQIYAREIYVLGRTGKTPLISITETATNRIQADNGLFFLVDGQWYAVRNFQMGRGQLSYGEWYKLVNGTWVDASSDVKIIITSDYGDVYIRGIHAIHVDLLGGGSITVGSSGELPTTVGLPPCVGGTKVPLEIHNLTITYIYPSNLSEGGIYNITPSEYRILIADINDSITTAPDLEVLVTSMNNSPWVNYEERRTSLVVRKYSKAVNITQDSKMMIITGALSFPVPYYSTLRIKVPPEKGYALFVVRDGDQKKALGIWRVGNTTYAGIWVNTTLEKVITGHSTYVDVPWIELFSNFNVENGRKIVGLWFYKKSLDWVYLEDVSGIGFLIDPKAEPFVIQLWVWDDS